MNIWGYRFAEVDQFIGYSKGLNIETNQRELEHYEKIGAMLPVARLVFPNDYVIKRNQVLWNGVVNWDEPDQWPALDRLLEGVGQFPFGSQGLTDEELVHCFDREMEAGENPHLIRPTSSDFQPWSEYSVTVHDNQGNPLNRSTVKHYYSYWQVHQLFWIQQYPDLYKNARLIERIPADDPVRMFGPWAPKNGQLVDFDGKRRNFDALSFWVTVYDRECSRTFAGIAEINGIRRLDDVQAATYRTRLAALAEKVTERFQLTPDDFYNFLRKLIELMENYERKERYKLAEALKRDIFAWEDLLLLTTGGTRDDVADELGKVSIYDKRTFPPHKPPNQRA